MKIIDAHLHFSNEPYFNAIARQAEHVNTEEHLHEQFKTHEVVHGVVMGNSRQRRTAGHAYPPFLSYCVGMNSAWLQPDEIQETVEMVEGHLLWNTCVGIKMYPGYDSFSVGDAICDPLYELAARYQKPVAVHTGYTADGRTSPWCHPDTVAEAASRWPDVQFVMCHMGNPWIDDGVAAMKAHANIAADLSGILEGKARSLEHLLSGMGAFVSRLRRAFASLDDYSRLLYGTDWPLANIGDYIGFIQHLIPQEHWQAVFYDNAKAVYDLDC